MTDITTTTLSNSVRAQYHDRYIKGAKLRRLYDQFAEELPKETNNFMGTSYKLDALNPLAPTETTISETSDITPQGMSDTYATVTPTSFGDGIRFSELLDASAYTNFNDKMGGYYYEVGEAAMASLELLAKKVCLNGTWVRRAAARASLNAGTNDMTWKLLKQDADRLNNAKAPWFVDGNGNMPVAVAHTFVSQDFLNGSSEPLMAVAQYQDKSYLVNGEIGMLAGVRLSFSPFAHVFWGAGTTNTTDVTTTISSAITPGDTTVTLTTVGSLAAGMHLVIGTTETSSTLYPQTEYCEVISVSSSTATIACDGPLGGFKFKHDALTAATNADSAYPILYGGTQSMGKVFASKVHGPFGQILDPEVDGFLKQWIRIGYKFYGNYGIYAQNRLMRREVSSSMDV